MKGQTTSRRRTWEPWVGSAVLPAALVLGDRVIERMLAAGGGRFGLWLPGVGRAVMVADPALVREVCRAPAEVAEGAGANRVQEPLIGRQGLGNLEGADHRLVRAVMAPAVRDRALPRLRQETERLAEEVAGACPLGTPFELRPRLHRAMMRAVLEITMSVERSRQPMWMEALRRLLVLADSYEITVRYALRHAGGLAMWPSYHRVKDACDRLVHDEIARRRRRGEESDDLLGLLLGARDERGAGLTDAVIRDQLMSVIAGARTTTSNGLAWAFERVVRHPEALRRLSEESREGAGEVYAGAVTYEALRVRPPVAFFGRRLLRPFDLGGRTLAAGTTVIIHLRSLHHHPGLYPDPRAFQPERWLERRPAGYGWMPFGGGTHTCLGDRLALLQMRTFLQVFTRTLALSPAGGRDEPVRWKAVSNTPGAGCRVVAHRR